MKNGCIVIFFTISSFAFGQEKHKEIHQFIDNWHKAATDADAERFFASMGDESVYIGTDATERWSKKAFIQFAKPYFDRGKPGISSPTTVNSM